MIFEINGEKGYVLKLIKAICDLHQIGRYWYKELHTKLLNNDCKEITGLTCTHQHKHK